MALPIVRSRDEAHLYMDLHPCPGCGGVDVTWDSALTSDEGLPARRYQGSCDGCGQQREFVFRLPERPALPDEEDQVFFGGPEPSQLFDAGEWWLIAGASMDEGSGPLTGGRDVELARRQAFAVAVAAVAEVLKFIPDGADAVPESAFWTEHGRAARDRDPELFTRDSLVRAQHSYRSMMADRFGRR